MTQQLQDDRYYTMHARFCAVLANPVRVQILEALENGEQTVGELTRRVGATLQNVSQHLRVIREQGAVKTRKVGKQVYYRIATPKLMEASRLFREALLEELADRSNAMQSGPVPPTRAAKQEPNQGRRRTKSVRR